MKKAWIILCLLLSLCLLCACNEGDAPAADAHTHVFGDWQTEIAATCTTKGTQKRTCECGESETKELDFAHEWGEWVETTAPTCTAKGVETRTCANCGAVKTRGVPTTAHNYNVNNVCADCNTAWPYTATGITYVDSGNTCYVSGVDADIASDVVIPYYHNGKKVTSIGADAFYGCTSLKSITIPDSVTSIGNSVFHDCTNLKSIAIPDGVTSIGSEAFFDCTSLKSITIPDNATSIGNFAFCRCTNLATVTFGANSQLTSIGNCAFFDCTALKSITIPDGVTSIGEGAFHGCTSLKSITIPDSVTSIGNFAFGWCDNLATVTFGANSKLTSIGEYAFYCTTLKSITIPDSVTSIGKEAFSYCYNLATVNCTTTGWWVSTDADATSGTAAKLTASNLTNAYCDYYWKRG